MKHYKTESNYYSDLDGKQGLTQAQLSIQQGKKLVRRAFMILGVGMIVVLIATTLALLTFPLEQISAFMTQFHLLAGFWRLAVFIILIGGWERWSQWYRRWGYLNDEQYQRLLAARWRMAFWILIIELLVVDNLPGQFANALTELMFQE